MIRCTALLCLSLAAAAPVATLIPSSAMAAAAPLDAVQFQVSATIAAGDAGGYVNIVTVPTGMRLTVQTTSFYRNNAPKGSIGQVFMVPTTGGSTGYVSLPSATVDASPYATATLSAVYYADAGTVLTANVYRSGATTGEEVDIITVTGYYSKQ